MLPSEISVGATLPRNIDARKDDTREIRDVLSYFSAYLVLKRRIWGPVNRYEVGLRLADASIDSAGTNPEERSVLERTSKAGAYGEPHVRDGLYYR